MPTQRNYEIYNKELLAIMLALEEFRRYLIDDKHIFEIWTDHANLQYFKKPQNLNRQQARWLTKIQEFHFTLHHIPGKSNSKADLLFRRAGFDQDMMTTEMLPYYPLIFLLIFCKKIPHSFPSILFTPNVSPEHVETSTMSHVKQSIPNQRIGKKSPTVFLAFRVEFTSRSTDHFAMT